MNTADKNQSSSWPRESLEFCPGAALCPPPRGTSGRFHRTEQWPPPCPLVLSTPEAPSGRRRTAGPGEQATAGLPAAGPSPDSAQTLPRVTGQPLGTTAFTGCSSCSFASSH